MELTGLLCILMTTMYFQVHYSCDILCRHRLESAARHTLSIVEKLLLIGLCSLEIISHSLKVILPLHLVLNRGKLY